MTGGWSTPEDVRAQVQRLWQRGELLRAAVDGDALQWPLRLRLRVPGAAELAARFEDVRAWVRALAGMAHVRVEWRQWRHRVLGEQRFPAALWLDSLPDALALIGKGREAQRFAALWQRTAAAQPALLAWLARRPLRALELADCWERLLAVVAWLQAHPRPGVYLRQVDAPGVDSKFIEAHKGVLAELLDAALPPHAIDAQHAGAAHFARRYGFLDKPVRIRLRLLDAALPSVPGAAGLLADITLDEASFAALALPAQRVFITENETNFLAFPPVAGAIAIFGAGYGWQALARAAWLQRCRVHYWGDIDTHGFAILNQLRAHLPAAASLLMDEETLLAHRAHWGEEAAPTQHDLPLLTPQEAAVYDALRRDRHQPRLRLEQERIGYGWLRARLGQLAHLAP